MEKILKRGKEKKQDDGKEANTWIKMILTVVKASLAAVVLTVLLFFLAAFILYIAGIDDSFVPITVTVIRILSACFAGFFSGRFSDKAGWFSGLISGIMYVLWTVIIGLFFYNGFQINNVLIADVIASAVGGMLSGMLGISLKKK